MSEIKNEIVKRLHEAQEQLRIQIPHELFDFISNLKQSEVQLGKEEWLFWTIDDVKENMEDNFIVSSTLDFQKEWNLKGLAFATNGIGDYLLLLPNEGGDGFQEKILVMMHEKAEIKLFADSLASLIELGPDDYYWSNEIYFKLDENNNLIKLTGENEDDTLDDLYDENDKLRSELDDLIDDQATEKASDIILGLEKLSESKTETHRVWALNKLIDLYLRGFGPVPQNLEMALQYNQDAMDLNSHKAYSNRAACYFAGIGMERDLKKALAMATKANELSKSNYFADILAKKEGGGMYDGLIDMIKKEIKKKK
jgi:hypothetical protein